MVQGGFWMSLMGGDSTIRKWESESQVKDFGIGS